MTTISKTHPCYNNPAMVLSIHDLGLSVRSINCLKADQIYYIGQLVTRSQAYLLKLPNLGRKSFREIQTQLFDLHSLEVGVRCDRALETIHDIEDFYGLKDDSVPLTKLYANVVLPVAETAGMNDSTIANIIQGRCQAAFERAVINEVTNAIAKVSSILSATPQKEDAAIPTVSTVTFPVGATKEVRVPLTCPQYLTEIFTHLKPDLLTKVANDLSGLTLYPELKGELELYAKPA